MPPDTELALPPASPRLGNFDEIFSVYFADVPVNYSAARNCLPPSSTLQRRPGRQVVDAKLVETTPNGSKAVPTLPPDMIGFLSGFDIFSFTSPHSLNTEKAHHESAFGDGGNNESSTASEDEPVVDAEPATGPEPDVIVVSANASPATAAAVALDVSERGLARTPPKQILPHASRFHVLSPPTPVKTSDSPRAGMQFSNPLTPSGYPTTASSPQAVFTAHLADNSIRCTPRTTKHEKLALIKEKLRHQYTQDRALTKARSQSTHVFIDLSNIVIGFVRRLRAELGIPEEQRRRMPPFFFEGLALLLERGRDAKRRVVVGSVRHDATEDQWPHYMIEAKSLNYELNILNRVWKAASPRPQRRHTQVCSRSLQDKCASSSGEETTTMLRPASSKGAAKYTEQGVDEILHLKMCHSLLDYEPGTLVLATGDGAEAKFSDGFLRHAERALSNGWNVEVVSWSSCIAGSWRSLRRKHRATSRFRIIQLDEFVFDLFGNLAGTWD